MEIRGIAKYEIVGFEYIPTLRRLAGSKKYPSPVYPLRPVEKSKQQQQRTNKNNKKRTEPNRTEPTQPNPTRKTCRNRPIVAHYLESF